MTSKVSIAMYRAVVTAGSPSDVAARLRACLLESASLAGAEEVAAALRQACTHAHLDKSFVKRLARELQNPDGRVPDELRLLREAAAGMQGTGSVVEAMRSELADLRAERTRLEAALADLGEEAES